MEGDINIVEHDSDKSGNPSKKLSEEEQDNWDVLLLRLGLEDFSYCDDFTHYNSLKYS